MDRFLVQVWVPAEETRCGTQLRGLVRHLATGVEKPFRNDEEVLSVLRGAIGPRRTSAGQSELTRLNKGVER